MVSYDVGENSLFDDRAEELIMHGPHMEIQLPKKKPDRIFGLKKTRLLLKFLMPMEDTATRFLDAVHLKTVTIPCCFHF
jgi:hypothetical protein